MCQAVAFKSLKTMENAYDMRGGCLQHVRARVL